MRLKKDRTSSPQQLAARHHLDSADSLGFLTRERRHILIHAGKTAIAAGLCWWLARRFGFHEGYWGAISAIIVLQSNFGSTIAASRDRLLGTLIGSAIGFTFTLFGTPPWNYLLAVFCTISVCGLLGFKTSARLAGVTLTIIMLVNTGSHWTLALDRVLQVVFGIVIALLVATFIFPDRARLRLRDGLAQEFLLLSVFFEAILQGFRGEAAATLTVAREDVLVAVRANNQLLEAVRNEPSGGPGWRESLSMLAQFGRSIFDALVALDLAVHGSHLDMYAQQLEPALGELVTDIQSGFHYLAACIQHWHFERAPARINLEEAIAKLETRMDSVRPTGHDFSQAEILRAYAVQLHLKQIARLLRAACVETNETISDARK